jgi:hypothetical protein
MEKGGNRNQGGASIMMGMSGDRPSEVGGMGRYGHNTLL